MRLLFHIVCSAMNSRSKLAWRAMNSPIKLVILDPPTSRILNLPQIGTTRFNTLSDHTSLSNIREVRHHRVEGSKSESPTIPKARLPRRYVWMQGRMATGLVNGIYVEFLVDTKAIFQLSRVVTVFSSASKHPQHGAVNDKMKLADERLSSF